MSDAEENADPPDGADAYAGASVGCGESGWVDAVPDEYDPDAVRERVFDYWDAVDAYERTKEHRADGEDFFFVDGPPYTSGAAHMGTTWNKTLKDVHIRYRRMQGYDVYDRPGYDMHGLPIETKVEERLGFDSKKDIEEFGEEAFIEECKQFADEQLEGLQSDFKSFGVWMDWEDPYRTVDPTYMESAWWAFQRAHERGLVERGKRAISQCPRCETAIADNEVEYHEIESPSIYVKFPLRGREGSLVIWTTTPWTIPANTFVAVDGEMTYQAVRARKSADSSANGRGDAADGESEVLWLAEECVEDVLREGRYEDYEVVEEVTGEEMVGWEYDHPLAEEVPEHPDFEGAGQVYTADYVEADRTGLVHSAPGHGQEDFDRGQELDLPEVFSPVGGDGVYTEAAGKYAGTFVRDANDDIIADLDAKGLLLASGTTRHRYGKCWRCDTDIVFLATDQWFITITDIKDELLENVEETDWYPQWARDNRFHDFIEDAPDWNVSRQRYWGIPIPIWTPENWSGDMSEVIVVGTREELAERVDQDVDPEAVDLHKSTVDDLTITEDGTTYRRVPDVFDVWLDSSVATWGTIGYPEEEEAFEELWPADLIMEAHDQTRGWFWSQLGMGSAAMERAPYEQVLMHGFANDENGRKMSKSVGNVVQPQEAIDRHGADAMRLFLLSVNPQGEDMRFSWDEMATLHRQLNILWNVFRFPLPYMAMDGFDPAEVDLAEAALETEDEWLLSRLQTVAAEATEHFDAFDTHRALDAVLEFVVEDISRYYVQIVRERMWEEEDTASKRAAYATLHHVLRETVAMLAPYAPFITEEIYQHLTSDGYASVHMLDWPEPDERYRDPELEGDVAVARDVEEAGSHARQQVGRKLRWPVRRVVVDAAEADVAAAVERHADLLADRLNARRIEVRPPGEPFEDVAYSAHADMSVLGPAFGEDAGDVMTALNEAHVEDPTLDALEAAVTDALGEDVELTEEMVEFVEDTPEGIAGAAFDGGSVYVDATLTEDIESEGYAREIIRRVQEMRKDLDLAMGAEIALDVEVFDERVGRLVADHEDLISEEVRAARLGEVAADRDDSYRKEWEIEGADETVQVRLTIRPVTGAPA